VLLHMHPGVQQLPSLLAVACHLHQALPASLWEHQHQNESACCLMQGLLCAAAVVRAAASMHVLAAEPAGSSTDAVCTRC
jgi:hypothetical protein